METTTCASNDDLRAYSLGTLDPQAALLLEHHLTQCTPCQELLNSVESSEDELILGLRHAGDGAGSANSPQVDLLIKLVRSGTTRGERQADRVTEGDIVAGAPKSDASSLQQSSPPTFADVPVSANDLKDGLLQSGLVSKEQLDEMMEGYSSSAFGKQDDALVLARWLVEQRRLTCFQAAELCRGRSRALKFGDYAILEEIGRGGMGRVYRALNARMDREAAVKVLSPHLFEEVGTKERFRRETRAIAKLAHPNVVTAYDAGEQDGALYLAMEYIDGANLGTIVQKQGPLPVRQAVDYLLQAAEGLAAAHGRRIVHRDVKPTNLLASRDGQVKVSDLGLARFLSPGETEEELTETGQILGTCDYISPEQAFDVSRADERSDIYSLGWTLFHLLTAEAPWPNLSRLEKLLAHRDAAVPSLREKRGDVPERLDQLFQRMVQKRPADRPQTIRAVIDELVSVPMPPDAREPCAIPVTSSERDLDQFFVELESQTREARNRKQSQQRETASWMANKRRVAIAVMLGFVVMAFVTYGIVVRWNTKQGEVVVELDNSYANALDIRIVRDGEVVKILDAKSGWNIHLDRGTYDISVGKGGDRFQVNRRNLVVEAGGKEMIRVEVSPPVTKAPVVVALPAKTKPTKAKPTKTKLKLVVPPAAVKLFGEIGKIAIPQRVSGMVLSPDKRLAYAGSTDRRVYVVDLETRTVLGTIGRDKTPTGKIALSHDGKRLAMSSAERTIQIWDVETSERLLRIPLPLSARCLAFSPDDDTLLVSLSIGAPVQPGPHAKDYQSLMLFDAASGAHLHKLIDDRQSFFWSLAFSPDGKMIAAGTQRGPILLIDAVSGGVKRRLLGHRGPTHAVVFSRDGTRLWSGGNGGVLFCRKLADGSTVFRRGFRSGVIGIDYNTNESRLLLEGTIDVRVLDVHTFGPQALTQMHGHSSPISGVLFLADEGQAISSAGDGSIRIWRLPIQDEAVDQVDASR